MSSWQGKSKGNKSGYQIFVWVLKTFGVAPAYFLLRFVVLYFFLFSYKSSKHIYALYHDRLKFGKINSLLKLYRNYYLLGQSIMDKVVVMSGIKNRFTYEFEGEENLRKMASLKKGGMLISGHIGNWDIAGHLLKRLDTVIHVIIYDGEQEKIKDYLSSITGKKSVNFIVIKDDLSHIYEISEAFNKNELVCMHADRFVEGNKTLEADFLGQKAKFPIGPFVLAATFKAPVSYVFAVKESNYHYHLFASKIKTYEGMGKAAIAQQMVAEFAKEMEIKTKKYPQQWFNYYDFWD